MSAAPDLTDAPTGKTHTSDPLTALASPSPTRKPLNSLPSELRHSLKVFIRAFAFGWVISSLPNLLGIVVRALFSKKLRLSALPAKLIRVLRAGVSRNGMPWLFGGVFGGHKLLDALIRWVAERRSRPSALTDELAPNKPTAVDPSVSSRAFCSALFSSVLALLFVHRRFPRTPTVDLTFFALVRALDVGAHVVYQSRRVRRMVPGWVLEHGDVAVFTVSCAEIMFAWFFEPDRLPKSYVRWISEMAAMEPRLLTALRLLRLGEICYGIDTGHNHILGTYCREIGLPERLADMRRARLPCVIVHGGNPGGCEVNAAKRWARGFWKAWKIYFPVHLLPPLLFRRHRLLSAPLPSLTQILLASLRSSAFLATFIALIWYSVCLVRTRVGYQLLRLPQQQLDNVKAPLLGCLLCGLSLLIENKHRRGEMALFVAPRALYAVWERVVSAAGVKGEGKAWEAVREGGECIAFAAAVATIVRAMTVDREMVRPSVRGLLAWMLD